MAIVNFAELLSAYEFASSGTPYDNAAYVCTETGAVYVTSSEVEIEEEVPEDLETSNRYLVVPTKTDLDLGRSLALRFTEQELPESYDEVANIFSKRGAYGRFKQLLESRRMLQRWFQFEATETEAALRSWCEENNLQVSQGHAPPVA
jgi:hypothetical protein